MLNNWFCVFLFFKMFFKSKEKLILNKYCGIFKIILVFVGSFFLVEFIFLMKIFLKELIFFYWNWKLLYLWNYILRKKKKMDNLWKLIVMNLKWIYNIFICFILFWVYIYICIWMYLSLNNIVISCNISVVFNLFKWLIFFLF